MTVDHILERADRLAKKSGLALSTISTEIFKDGKRIAALKKGRRAWPETLAAASELLSDMEAAYGIKTRVKTMDNSKA